MPRPRITALAIVLVLLVGSVPPAAAAGIGMDDRAAQVDGDGNVSVTVGQQLTTLMVETDSDVRHEVDETRFEVRFSRSADDQRADAVAERAAELAHRATALNAAYREASRAHAAGELSDAAFAARIAELNARGEDLAESARRLRARAAGVSTFELRVAGFSAAELRAVDRQLDPVTGAGAHALLERFTGRTTGEVRIEARDGLSIEVEREDGAVSRELERDRDADNNLTVAQSTALETARAALGTPPVGNWTLERASVHEGDGYYRFRFALTDAPADGVAEVRVDGSSGEVFRLESEVERDRHDRDDDDREDDERDHDELALVLVEGRPAPGATVTLQALARGEPVADAVVTLNDHRVGTTNARGAIEVTLPREEVELRVRAGDRAGELEFAFDDRDREHDDLRRGLAATARADGETVHLAFRFDGEPLAGVTVLVDGREVGSTDRDGTLTFHSAAHDDLELTLRRGALVAELEFESRDGSLQLVEVDFEREDRHEDDRETGDDHEDDGGTQDGEDHETADGQETDTADRETDQDLAVHIVRGTPAPGATVVVAVSAGDAPVEGAAVSVNDRMAGQTDAEGRLTLTLPDVERVEIVAELGDRDGAREFRFESADDDDADDRR